MCFTTIHNISTSMLVSRSGQLQEQGFSVEVAERIAAPQRSSTRTIYKSKWALFEKWCRENSVDFSTSSVKQISDCFMYLYQDRNRHPSTIDGYRTAIVDTLGPTGHHNAQCSDLHRLLSSFYRDRPKSSRNLPKWNLCEGIFMASPGDFKGQRRVACGHVMAAFDLHERCARCSQ